MEHNQSFKLKNLLKSNYNAIVFYHDSKDRKMLAIDRFKEYHFKGKVFFEPEGTYFARMHKAIESIPDEALRKIVPSDARFHGLKYTDPTDNVLSFTMATCLDKEQISACFKILNSKSVIPTLILGPFGTGKTQVLVEVAQEIICQSKHFNKPKVLLVAHHQSSADNIAHLFCKFNNHSVRVIRICKANELSKQKGNVIYIPINEIHDASFLDRFDVIVTTLGTSYSVRLKIHKHRMIGYFTHILIDEGAQTREPEAIIPLCFAGYSTKIVIAGDHCQVEILRPNSSFLYMF